MDTIQTVFLAAINAASSDLMKGLFMAGFMFVLGFVPAMAARIFTCGLDLAD